MSIDKKLHIESTVCTLNRDFDLEYTHNKVEIIG